MKRIGRLFFGLLPLLCVAAQPKGTAHFPPLALSRSESKLQEYFRAETAHLSEACLSNIKSLHDWEDRRGEYRRQLQEMLGLYPWPERTELKPVITGKIEQDDFTVEKLHFQASPGLYVTANLYLPKKVDRPAPAILYVCGHSRVITNGVSCGNKAGYQQHGVWFARNGYVCLLIDTLQLGEIQGAHRGTHTEGQWWWNSRGYTPAGIEAWFGIRALDYLCTRPEVDPERIGMTGRSGGGSYSWTVGALDDRVKVAAPVAGITDLQDQVVDGAVDSHCDCMFYVNTYRWDFPLVAALLAPRPLLIGNSDKDRLFSLPGVVRLHEQTRRIYSLYGATNKLGLLITEGPHADTQDLQLPVFRWFNRFLKGEDPVIEMAARKRFDPQQLRVFDGLPQDQVNTTVQQTFVPAARQRELAAGPGSDQRREELTALLRKNVFAGWPCDRPVVAPELCGKGEASGLHYEVYGVYPQAGVELWLWVVRDAKVKKPERITLTVLDPGSYTDSPASGLWLSNRTDATWRALRKEMQSQKAALAFVAPRLVEPAKWLESPARLTRVRRRFMLLGQTLDSMRVWDIRCSVGALRSLREFQSIPLFVHAKGQMGVNAAYAALFEPGIQKLELQDLPTSHREGPDYLKVMTVTDIPQVLELLRDKTN